MTVPTSVRLAGGALLLIMAGVAAAQNAATTESVDVYAGPDPSYPQVARLQSDTPVQVMGCLNDWSWCDVRFGEADRGWLYAPAISYDYQGGYVPLYRYAPGLGIPVVAFSLDSYWGSYYHNRPWYGRRAEYMHRDVSHHQRPSGPPPSAGPPPREARMDKPHAAGQSDRSAPQSDRSVRLSSAEASHRPPARSTGERDHAGTSAPEPHAAAARRDESPAHPAQHTAAEHATAAHPARTEQQRNAKPAPKEEHPSSKDKERNDHPGPG